MNLQKALQPIVRMVNTFAEDLPDNVVVSYFGCERLTAGDLRALAAYAVDDTKTVAAVNGHARLRGIIREYIRTNGVPPIIRELVRLMGVTSTSTIKYHLDILKEYGWIDWEPRKARTIRLLKGGR